MKNVVFNLFFHPGVLKVTACYQHGCKGYPRFSCPFFAACGDLDGSTPHKTNFFLHPLEIISAIVQTSECKSCSDKFEMSVLWMKLNSMFFRAVINKIRILYLTWQNLYLIHSFHKENKTFTLLHRGLLGIAVGDDDYGETKTYKYFIVLMEISQEGR